MKIKQLVHFTAVVENGSFNSAAKELYTAQSSLSSSVAELERELGFELLTRSSHGVQPTGMGTIVYENIKEVLHTLDGYQEQWEKIYRERAQINTPVVAAVVPSLYAVFNRKVIAALKVDYPNLNIAVFEGRGELLEEYIESGRVDMIFSDCIESDFDKERKKLEKKYDTDIVGYDCYKLAVKKSRNPEGKGDLKAEDVKGCAMACYNGEDKAAAMFEKLGFASDKRIELTSIERIYQAAANGSAIGCLPEKAISMHYAPKEKEEISFLTFEGKCIPFVHFSACRRDEKIIEVYKIIKEKFKEVL